MSDQRGLDFANIEIFRPCPHPPVLIADSDDAWLLCAAVRADGDALLAVLADSDQRVIAVAAAGTAFVAAACRDPAPLVRLIELFETSTIYLAATCGEADPLVEQLSAELWPGVVTVRSLPPLPDLA